MSAGKTMGLDFYVPYPFLWVLHVPRYVVNHHHISERTHDGQATDTIGAFIFSFLPQRGRCDVVTGRGRTSYCSTTSSSRDPYHNKQASS